MRMQLVRTGPESSRLASTWEEIETPLSTVRASKHTDLLRVSTGQGKDLRGEEIMYLKRLGGRKSSQNLE